MPYLACGGAACLSPQGCPSGPFPASRFAPDLSNFDAVIVAGHCWPGKREVLADSSTGERVWPLSEVGALCAAQVGAAALGGICSVKEKTLHKRRGFWATVFSQGENTSRHDFVGWSEASLEPPLRVADGRSQVMWAAGDRMATREEKSLQSCTGVSRSCIPPLAEQAWFPLVRQDLSV